MISPFLALIAALALLFGVALAAVPEPLLALFNVQLDLNASLFARVLGGSWLGYAVINWYGRTADARGQRTVLTADLLVAVTGLAASLYVALQGQANPLVWVWIVLFVVFGIAQVYFLSGQRRAG